MLQWVQDEVAATELREHRLEDGPGTRGLVLFKTVLAPWGCCVRCL